MPHDAMRGSRDPHRGPTQGTHTEGTHTEGTHTDPNRGPTQRGGPHRGPTTGGEGYTGAQTGHTQTSRLLIWQCWLLGSSNRHVGSLNMSELCLTTWHLHSYDIAITNIVCCMAYEKLIGRGVLCCALRNSRVFVLQSSGKCRWEGQWQDG